MLTKGVIHRSVSCAAIFVSLATTLACKETKSIEYRLVELSPPSECFPMDINELNEVLCGSIYGNYILRDEEYIPLLSDSELSPGSLLHFNSIGMAVGLTNLFGYPSLYDNGSVTIMDSFGPGGSQFTGINQSGVAVGWIGIEGSSRGFVYENGELSFLSGCTGFDYVKAMGINNSDQIVLSCSDRAGRENMTMVIDRRQENIPFYDAELHSLNAISHGINDQRVVIGTIKAEKKEPFIYYPDSDRVVKFGIGESCEPLELNNVNQVVGAYKKDGEFRAFIYDEVHGTRDLNNLVELPEGYNLMSATSINDEGYITVVGSDQNGWNGLKGFILIPIAPNYVGYSQ